MDYNATAPMYDEVKELMFSLFNMPSNGSSVHYYGREAQSLISKARDTIVEAIGAQGKQLIFTATGTEANNLILKGLEGYELVVSAIEHASVLQAVPDSCVIPVDSQGLVQLDALEQLLAKKEGQKISVSVMLANNETGVIQPMKEIVEIAHRYGALVHTDAVQALGKVALDINALGVDACTLSSHKIGGPVGAAALIFNKSLPLQSQIQGGGQEFGFRAGTENVTAIAGFEKAVLLSREHLIDMNKVASLRDYLEQEIAAIDACAVLKLDTRLPNTASISMVGVSSETQLIHFDMEHIAVSAGSACSSGRVSTSHVLEAMGVEQERAKSTIRVSLGRTNTQEDIEQFIAAWRGLYLRTNDDKKAA
jgi:cysteine desulfurase